MTLAVSALVGALIPSTALLAASPCNPNVLRGTYTVQVEAFYYEWDYGCATGAAPPCGTGDPYFTTCYFQVERGSFNTMPVAIQCGNPRPAPFLRGEQLDAPFGNERVWELTRETAPVEGCYWRLRATDLGPDPYAEESLEVTFSRRGELLLGQGTASSRDINCENCDGDYGLFVSFTGVRQ